MVIITWLSILLNLPFWMEYINVNQMEIADFFEYLNLMNLYKLQGSCSRRKTFVVEKTYS